MGNHQGELRVTRDTTKDKWLWEFYVEGRCVERLGTNTNNIDLFELQIYINDLIRNHNLGEE